MKEDFMMRERLAFGVWMLAAACTGCGNGDANAAAPQAGGGAETRDTDGARADDAPYAQPAPWPEMDMAQRLQFMQQVVMPEMRARFQEYDPERYADFDCTTCHGESAAQVGFAMPNGLTPLDPDTFPLTESDDAQVAETAHFMEEEVVPAMADLLDATRWSPDNPDGFGCLSCHAHAE
jgi:hypothetical protein